MALSPREAEVLAAVARHRTNAEIAAELFISVRTVESHVSALLRKLDAADRRQLAERAAAVEVEVDDRPEMVGRQEDLAKLRELMATSGPVTVVGPGGVGKTTLVSSLSGAVLIDLTTLPAASPTDLVAQAALAALGAEVPDGRTAPETLALVAVRRSAPIVLDNCEHLLEAAATVVRLLAGTGARVAATSRERLGVPGERLLTLAPLTGEAARDLFVRRAAELQPPASVAPEEYPLVDAVCAAVDHLPLAVGLAAARLGQLDLPDLAEAVSGGIDVLEGGDRSATRHRSVRTMLDWSYGLLAPGDQRVHRRLSVLAGPFRVATATAVAGAGTTVAPAVARLVEASLLVRIGTDRYRQLDLVRRHAAECLAAAGEVETAETALVAWAAGYATAAAAPAEDADLRAAAEVAGRSGDGGARLLRRLGRYWADRGADSDAIAMWERAASASGMAADALEAAELAMARWQGDEAFRLFALAAQLADDAGDGAALVRSLESQVELAVRFPATVRDGPDPTELQRLWQRVAAVDTGDDLVTEGLQACAEAWAHGAAGDLTGARESGRRAVALAAAAEDPVVESIAWDALSWAAHDDGDAAAIHEVAERRLLLRERLGGSARAELELSDVETMAVEGCLAVGRFEEARAHAERLLAREVPRGLAHVGLGRLVSAEFQLGRFDDALAHAAEAVEAWEDYGAGAARYLVAPIAACMAISGFRGRSADERSWLALADRLSARPEGTAGSPLMRSLRADVHLFHGRLEEAAALVAESPWDLPGGYRSTYASVRAAVLGGTSLEEADRLVRGDRKAAGVVARARGDLEEATTAFAACGAAFEVARTSVLLGQADAPARLDRFLRPAG